MPIYNSKDLIPFVNQLESKISDMNESLKDWNNQKVKVINSVSKTESNYQIAMSALVKADEALSEIGTASFASAAKRGKRLEDTLNKLKNEMYDIAASVGGSGNVSSLSEGLFFDELNNAIASVDVTIEDGLKLDYRLRELADMSTHGANLGNKTLFMPYKYEVSIPSKQFVIQSNAALVFVDGEVTILNQSGDVMLDDKGKIIIGSITNEGQVELSATPKSAFIVYFPVRMKLGDIPEEFLYLFLQQIVQKNSRVMEFVLNFETAISEVLQDIKDMKGVNWTPDYSIMKNHQDVIRESITPKGLNVEVKDGMAHVTFSCNEHPALSHCVLEKWSEEEKAFVPYDGQNGIIHI
ncbi:hypothetical protein KC480_05270 [Bacillus velezensis]|uniref:hypothetical protein n=1 Tax=Bacillus velezensis TaxID=492670 RepID=UPI001E5139AE|nr:hypothetical protein [Bacillus velezensis]MCD7910935.1 hypothetical protein [Bacillus velezensis]